MKHDVYDRMASCSTRETRERERERERERKMNGNATIQEYIEENDTRNRNNVFARKKKMTGK
jgi:hypothetical protein